MSASFLTPEILEEEHTAKTYLPWVRGLVERVKTEPDGLRRLLLREGYAKQLMNEAMPIGCLASTYFAESDDVRIKLKIGSQNFDAEVSDRRGHKFATSFVEVTLAHEGEDEYLRSRVLHDEGEVSALGRVTKQGTKRTGLFIEVEREMISQDELLRRERDLIERAILRKLGKGYPRNTLLLIGFDDTIAADRSVNIENINAILTAHLPKMRAFCALAVVGLQRGLLLHRCTGNAI